MRPSNYNYLKRMWTRNVCKNSNRLWIIVSFPFKIIFKIFIFPFVFVFKIIKILFSTNTNLNSNTCVIDMNPTKATIYKNTISSDNLYILAYDALYNFKPTIASIQRCLKIGFNQAKNLADELEKFKVIRKVNNYEYEILIEPNEFIKICDKINQDRNDAHEN